MTTLTITTMIIAVFAVATSGISMGLTTNFTIQEADAAPGTTPLYAVDPQDRRTILVIDPDTGDTTKVSLIGPKQHILHKSLSFDESGSLIAMGSRGQAIIIDPVTGDTIGLGQIGCDSKKCKLFRANSIDHDLSGTLYGNDFRTLFTIDLVTLPRIATAVGTFSCVSDRTCNAIEGIAFAPDGTLYGISASGAPSKLYTIDPATADTTYVADLRIKQKPGWVMAPSIQFGIDGTLYAGTSDGNPRGGGLLLTVDPGSGKVLTTTNLSESIFTLGALAAPHVTNQPPVCDDAASTNGSIWPPNHKMTSVGIDGVTDPDGDVVTISVTGIQQDEALDAKGDGNTEPDGIIDGDSAQVRAERSGTGDGRIYEISFLADDGNGGTCTGSVFTGVPHDKKDTPIDSGVRFDSTS